MSDAHPIRHEIASMIEVAEPVEPEPEHLAVEVHPRQAVGDDSRNQRRSQADDLVELASGLQLFHAPGDDGDGYVVMQCGEHSEVWPVRSRGFKQWLSSAYWAECEKAPNSQAVQDAHAVIGGKAVYDGNEQEVAVRLAAHDGTIYLDLCDADWRVVEIDANGWRVIPGHLSPIRFIRKHGMLALPEPVTGGSLEDLRRFVNVPDDPTWVLTQSWLVASVRPGLPCPILALNGEQGCGKSTLSKMFRMLVDPNKAPLRRPPRDVRDLMIAASNGWLVVFDNLSGISADLSDALCCLSTGGGFATRALYSDDGEKLFDAMRPVILNGIDDLGSRSDLMDRSLHVTLPTIPDGHRRDEDALWSDFHEARPSLIGALLDAVVVALRNYPTVRLDAKPRMADFAKWAVAAEPALGCEPGAFLKAYTTNREDAHIAAIEASAVGPAIMALIEAETEWTGTATNLLAKLNDDRYADAKTCSAKAWPKTPRGISNAVRRLAPNLRRAGLAVEFPRKAGGIRDRLIQIEKVGNLSSLSSRPSQDPPGESELPICVGRNGEDRDASTVPLRPAKNPPSESKSPIWDDRDGRDDRIPTKSMGSGDDPAWGPEVVV